MNNVPHQPIRSLTALPDKNYRRYVSTIAPAPSPIWSIRLGLSSNIMFIPVRDVRCNGLTGVKRYRRKFALFPRQAGKV